MSISITNGNATISENKLYEQKRKTMNCLFNNFNFRQNNNNHPDIAATTSDEKIPTVPSPRPFLLRSRAVASALSLNI